MIRVFLAGEGKTELGGWAAEHAYREAKPSVGVIEALLRTVAADGWIAVDAACWKNIRKYRARPPMPAEVRNVLGVALQARESGADVLAFARDRDRDRDRERDVLEGVARARRDLSQCPNIVGGVAVETIEAWVLALSGERGSYRHARPKERMDELGIRDPIGVIDAADPARPDLDAPSLQAWLQEAKAVLGAAS